MGTDTPAEDGGRDTGGSAAEPPGGHPAVAVHSLLHCNLNTTGLHASAAFYGDVLGLTTGMKTDPAPVDGRVLGVDGEALTETWFLYDHRGPRAAPAVEVLEWRSPATVGEHPGACHHVGLSSLGYLVASLPEVAARLQARGDRVTGRTDALRLGGTPRAALRTIDPDGVPLELVEDAGAAAGGGPVFSHIRLNCTDLAATVAWYTAIGFHVSATAEEVTVPGAFTGLPSPAVCSTATLALPSTQAATIELTQWHKPSPIGRAAHPAYHRGLYRIALAVDDVQAAHAVLSRRDPATPQPVPVPLPGTRIGVMNVLFLRDPDGVVVELVERPRSAMTGLRRG